MFVAVIPVFTACVGFALLAFDPLIDVCSFLSVGVDDKVFVDGFGDLFLDFAAGGIIGDVPVCSGCGAFKDDHPAFFGDGGECIFDFVYWDIEGLVVIVPTEFLCKKVFKVGFFEVLAFSCQFVCVGEVYEFNSESRIDADLIDVYGVCLLRCTA